MTGRSRTLLVGLAAVASVAATLTWPAPSQAQDFFQRLFGGFSQPEPQSRRSMPSSGYSNEGDERPSRPQSSSGGSASYCVRTCDGRYFPIPASDRASRAATCSNLCPAAETQVYHGGAIDYAVSDRGKSYSDLPNAFRYRNELVSGCTCNGKDVGGLAQMKIDDDPTLRSGDIVAGENGLLVARRSDRRGASVSLTPAAQSVQARYQRPRIVARD